VGRADSDSSSGPDRPLTGAKVKSGQERSAPVSRSFQEPLTFVECLQNPTLFLQRCDCGPFRKNWGGVWEKRAGKRRAGKYSSRQPKRCGDKSYYVDIEYGCAKHRVILPRPVFPCVRPRRKIFTATLEARRWPGEAPPTLLDYVAAGVS